MATKQKSVQVMEVLGQCSKDPASGNAVHWERKHLELAAYDGHDAYSGTLPLEERGHWTAGVHEDLDDATFKQVLGGLQRIPDEDIYPPEAASTAQEYFFKKPNLSSWSGNDATAKLFLEEARMNEMFLAHPHPRLGIYLGCVVRDDGRIVGLAFPKYIQTLSERVAESEAEGGNKGRLFFPGERERCMSSMEEAARHIHALGYAHNDISGCNIMFDGDSEAVLIDLDSCAPIGETIKKGGVAGGWRGPRLRGRKFEYSSVECDEASLDYVRQWAAMSK